MLSSDNVFRVSASVRKFVDGLICTYTYKSYFRMRNICLSQGFMQDKIIASHTYFGGHMDVNC